MTKYVSSFGQGTKTQLHLADDLTSGHLSKRKTCTVSTLSVGTVGGMIGCGEGVMYLKSPGRPTDIGLQLGKVCYPCSR